MKCVYAFTTVASASSFLQYLGKPTPDAYLFLLLSYDAFPLVDSSREARSPLFTVQRECRDAVESERSSLGLLCCRKERFASSTTIRGRRVHGRIIVAGRGRRSVLALRTFAVA